MAEVTTFLILIAAVLGFSTASAFLGREQFSINSFLVAFSIGIGVLVWIPYIPFYFILLSIIAIAGMIFMNRGGSQI